MVGCAVIQLSSMYASAVLPHIEALVPPMIAALSLPGDFHGLLPLQLSELKLMRHVMVDADVCSDSCLIGTDRQAKCRCGCQVGFRVCPMWSTKLVLMGHEFGPLSHRRNSCLEESKVFA